MKKTASTAAAKKPADDLAPEYRFDYRKAKPNRFAVSYRVECPHCGETFVEAVLQGTGPDTIPVSAECPSCHKAVRLIGTNVTRIRAS